MEFKVDAFLINLFNIMVITTVVLLAAALIICLCVFSITCRFFYGFRRG